MGERAERRWQMHWCSKAARVVGQVLLIRAWDVDVDDDDGKRAVDS